MSESNESNESALWIDPPDPRLILVIWEDASTIADWQTQDEVNQWASNPKTGGYLCRTMGWLVYQDDACIVLAANRDREGTAWGLSQRIPRPLIRAVWRLDIGNRTFLDGDPDEAASPIDPERLAIALRAAEQHGKREQRSMQENIMDALRVPPDNRPG